jgi:hypothetical protein
VNNILQYILSILFLRNPAINHVDSYAKKHLQAKDDNIMGKLLEWYQF